MAEEGLHGLANQYIGSASHKVVQLRAGENGNEWIFHVHVIAEYLYAWTHTADSDIPDQMISKVTESRCDHSQAPPSIVRFTQLIMPILLTFTL